MKTRLEIGDMIHVRRILLSDQVLKVTRIDGNKASLEGHWFVHTKVWNGRTVYPYRKQVSYWTPTFTIQP